MALFDGAGFLSNTIIPRLDGGATSRRVPFTFTSTARLLKSGQLNAIGKDYSKLAAANDRSTQLAAIEEETRGKDVAQQLGVSQIVQTVNNVRQQTSGFDMPIVSMAINPHSIQWQQNKRVTKRDTMEGSTFFHFTDSADRNNDILTMVFSGRTGNINTQAEFLDALKTGANLKLRTWHELYSLSREPILLNKENTGIADMPHGIKNEFFITYRTMLMPLQITLVGFFSNVLQFEESADDPFNRNYSFTFTVTATNPELDKLVGLMDRTLSVAGQFGREG